MNILLTQWTLKDSDGAFSVPATVPGDITNDLHKAGIIADPFFGFNHLTLKERLDKDYVYTTEFTADELPEKDEDVFIAFDGVDLFADVYLNGVLLGKTENMFKKYVYDIGNVIKKGKNTVEVFMHSTTKFMETVDTKDYFGVFNVQRILLRKEQCCFGWDWSPNIPGYGIWQNVRVYTENKCRITDVCYTANAHGEATFFIEINYSVRSYYDNDGNFIEVKKEHDDYIRVSLAKKPGGGFENAEVKQVPVSGSKSFIGFFKKDPQLWWPIGYGEHPLYNYKVELVRDGRVISEKNGRMAYREVTLEQRPVADDVLSYRLKINGEPIYMKGSNWVPVDCFTGCVTDEKYEKLILQAVKANINTLRVWGGGIYEKDVFYDLCDENGIMVWQDLMFACADIPEDDEKWVKNASEEIEYQVKRLRNHPSLVYWCGGNEKTGSTGAKIVRGDWFVNIILRGIVGNFDNTRPFAKQSPCSLTDVANDLSSGESHKNSFELTIKDGFGKYRENVAQNTVPFISESALMGPHSRQTFEKIFPKDELWPINDLWRDRLMENPYAAIRLSFADLEYKFASELYGTPENLDDFIAKGMLTHAQAFQCECEYQRAGKGITAGFLNWMYSEIWPSGTWSAVDYYTEPKAVYYQMKRSYAPVLMSFFYRKDGKTVLFGVNDTLQDKIVSFEYGLKRIADGKVIWEKSGETVLSKYGAYNVELTDDIGNADTYLYVAYSYDGIKTTTLYSPNFWSGVKFESDYAVKKEQLAENRIAVTVKANKFAKSVFVNMSDNYKCDYSDNYFDLEAGEKKTIIISSAEKIDVKDVEITDLGFYK